MTTCSEGKVHDLILASTSPYRRQQLKQLGVRFAACSPLVEEVCQEGESPVNFALRMAEAKAKAVAAQYPDAWVVGADQVCEFQGDIIRKPGSHEIATAQLSTFSGKQVLFHSALSVTHFQHEHLVTNNTITKVTFKKLTAQQIESYLKSDQPYDCAGAFKIESQGLRLMQSVQSNDPSALVGLPLIALCDALDSLGFVWN